MQIQSFNRQPLVGTRNMAPFQPNLRQSRMQGDTIHFQAHKKQFHPLPTVYEDGDQGLRAAIKEAMDSPLKKTSHREEAQLPEGSDADLEMSDIPKDFQFAMKAFEAIN